MTPTGIPAAASGVPVPAASAAEPSRVRPRPEVLSPAGDRDCARAAVENGADAVYFGLSRHNARARATNFTIEELPEFLSFLHLRGVKGYVAFNTLVFSNELGEAAATLEKIIAAGPEALIVQDLGIARLARAICPDVVLHASTQTTTTAAEEMPSLLELGFSRVILARELTLEEIKAIAAATPMELEVFVHGALCIAYSGQCLTSEALGGRSANRGACAQACRLPYELIVDGILKDLGPKKYLLSPQDLAAFEVIPDLVQAGVRSFKIEGRLKTPEYVAATARAYRKAVDEAWAHRTASWSRDDVLELQQVFSRGFSPGFLRGIDHQELVPALSPKKRGPALGIVSAIRDRRVSLRLEGPLKPGDGVSFDYGSPDEESGGRVYEIRRAGRAVPDADSGDAVELAFGENLDWSRVHVGDRVWKTSDPALEKRLRASFEKTARRMPVDAVVSGRAGTPLRLELTDATHTVSAESSERLETARKRPLAEAYLREHLDRLGDTPFELRKLELRLEGEVILPVSQINDLRRRAAAALERARRETPGLPILPGALERLREGEHGDGTTTERTRHGPAFGEHGGGKDGTAAVLIPLCRSLEQLDAVLAAGSRHVELDFEDIRRYADGVSKARAAGAWVALAPPRIFKPGEAGILKRILSFAPDAVLVRNRTHLDYFHGQTEMIGDFSLNIANELAADWHLGRGLERFTPSHDLNVEQLEALLHRAPVERAELVVHQRMPMFHMEHCVIAHTLSSGHDATDCGRPCDRHRLALRDRTGREHPLKADVGCRNTIYNAVAQSASAYVRRFMDWGVRWFRVELMSESGPEAAAVVRGYGDLLTGRGDGDRLWKELRASNEFGVTRGPLGQSEAAPPADARGRG